MNYQFIENIERTQLNEFVRKHPLNNIYQTSNWAGVKADWLHRYVAVKEEGEIVASAMILFRKLPLGLKMAYIPRGPVMDYSNEELVCFTLKSIKEFCKKNHAFECKFDPNIVMNAYEYHQKEEAQNTKNDELVAVIEKAGAKFNGYNIDMTEAVQPRFQMCFPIEEDVDGRIGKKTMDKVKSSFKKGVEIKDEGVYGARHLAKVIEFTENRKGISLRSEEYFDNMLKQFEKSATVLTASINNNNILDELQRRKAEYEAELSKYDAKAVKKTKQLTKLIEDTETEIEKVKKQRTEDGAEVLFSGLLLVHDGRTCELLYSGLNEKYRRYLAAYSLRYKAIEWAKKQGCTRFNFGGVEGSLDDGLFTFKSSFNPNIEVYLGEFEMVCNPALSSLFNMALSYRKKKMKKGE